MKVLYLKKGLTVHVGCFEQKVLPGELHDFDILNESLEHVETFNGCFRNYLKSIGKDSACLAIGFFDGVHIGHQEVIKTMLKDALEFGAEGVVVTFDRHPLSVVAPKRKPSLITTTAHKMKLLAELNVPCTVLLPFDQQLSRLPAETFVECLNYEIGKIRTISVGGNFLFGHNQGGDVELLKAMGRKLGFEAQGIKPVALERKRVSSTRIREAIKNGDLDLASKMLGRAYSIFSRVIKGMGVGKTIGFPTANLDISGLVLPPCGVYAARVQSGSQKYKAILNLGYKPTVSQENPVLNCEVYIFDFDQDLYDKNIEVVFIEKIREEKKFSSLNELKSQIQKDILTAHKILDANS